MRVPLQFRALLIALLMLPLSGCFFRSHRVAPRLGAASLKEATKDQLISIIDTEAAKIQTLNATVDISAEVGGAKKGKVTDYQDIRGYLLVREPEMLRLIGLFPVVRNTAFDMVSDGTEFKLSIPVQKKFITGSNNILQPTTASLENLRPQVIFDALLLHQIDPKTEIAVLENGTEEVLDPKTHKNADQPDYMVTVIRKGQDGWYLNRKIVFSRVDLLPHRQLVYDKQGNIATDARYEKFQSFNGANFPATIQIIRPQEEYSIILTIVKMTINQALRDDQFALAQPPGSQLVDLDKQQPTGLRAADGHNALAAPQKNPPKKKP
jgi:outer membrane lipoprotein-sorting protein